MRFPPSRLLERVVECYWAMRNGSSGAAVQTEHVVADAGVEVFFNFGDAYHRSNVGEPGDGMPVAGSHVVGVRPRPIVVTQTGRIDLFGVRFRPGGLAPLVRFPLSDILHDVVELEVVFGEDAVELEQRLWAAASDRVRVRLMDDVLIGMCSRRVAASRMGEELCRVVARSAGSLSVDGLSELTGMGYKRLERLFRREVGVLPKLYSRLVRFQLASSRAPRDPARDPELPDGYYDQAHFLREFRRFAGESPSRFFARRQRISGTLLDGGRVSNLYKTARDAAD